MLGISLAYEELPVIQSGCIIFILQTAVCISIVECLFILPPSPHHLYVDLEDSQPNFKTYCKNTVIKIGFQLCDIGEKIDT